MYGLKVPLKQVQKVKQSLADLNLIDRNKLFKKTKTCVVFPLSKKPSASLLAKKFKTAELVETDFAENNRKPRSLKDALKNMLSPEEKKHLITSFDTVGNTAVIEIPEELEHKQKEIGKAIIEVNTNIETVLKISGAHQGEFRIQPVKPIAGKKTTVATYKEHGCVFKLDLAKSFFSPRLGTERFRISKQIKEGEEVGAFFAGVGPFPIVFAKNSPMKKAFAVELNPDAVKDMKQNIALNKCEEKVFPIPGDVNKVVPEQLVGKCDRVTMPLPKGGEHFLESAFLALKPGGGVIHFYQFEPADNPFKSPLERIEKTAKKFNRKIKILYKKKVRSFSPKDVQVVIDFRIE